jgi:hypothetical protein
MAGPPVASVRAGDALRLDARPLSSSLGFSTQLSRWVLANQHQELSEIHNLPTVEVQTRDRRAPRRSETHDLREVLAPREVVMPRIAPRVVERNGLAARGVDRLSASVLVAVATLAGVGKVGRSVASASRARHDVFRGEWVWGVRRGRETILAATARALLHKPALTDSRRTFSHRPARRDPTA